MFGPIINPQENFYSIIVMNFDGALYAVINVYDQKESLEKSK